MALPHTLLQTIPSGPGIYKMLDTEGRVIYVGKAKDLHTRVRNYFQKDYTHSTRTRKLLETATRLEFISTDSELEALLLEHNIIKDLRPKYNILMKDDKSYVYIKVDMGEDFPRIRIVREKNINLDRAMTPHARYFGPKLATSKVYETLRILKKLFPFRHCQLDIQWKVGSKNNVEVKNRVIDFPCIDYFIKRCPGPCIGAVEPVEYKKVIQEVISFLEGKTEELEKKLEAEMKEAAQHKLFEKAARLRDKIFALQSIGEKQKITDLERSDTDIINFALEFGHLYFNVLMIRDGKLINHENFSLDALELTSGEAKLEIEDVLESFLTQYYEKVVDLPKEILLPAEIESQETLEIWLTQKKGTMVKLLTPQRGQKNKLLELAEKNAISFAKQSRIKWLAEAQHSQASERLAQLLAPAIGGKVLTLNRIEGFDISHLGGDETVASMVVFERGAPKQSHYRHFTLRSVQGKPDDYQSMEEVLTRRLKYLAKPMNVRLAPAGKKHLDLIKKWAHEQAWKELAEATELKDFKHIHVAVYEKKPIGMIGLRELQTGIFEISALYITPEQRGNRLSYAILEKIIKKVKNKRARFYVQAEASLLSHYATFGFTPVRDAPEVIKQSTQHFAAIDGKNYEILGFYPTKRKAADPSFMKKPDLLLIDGGKGQLASAVHALQKLQLDIPVISLAKRLEEIFVPGQPGPIVLEEGDEALKLLQRVRDESHRFAITFQRSLHRKSLIHK